MSPRIQVDREKITELCQRHGILRLDLHMSVRRDDFIRECEVDVPPRSHVPSMATRIVANGIGPLGIV